MTEDQKGIRLSDSQRLSWLRLIRSENVGPVTFRHLIARYGSASAALEMLPELVRRGGGRRPIRIASLDEARREMAMAARMGAVFTGIGEPDYPPYLRHAGNPCTGRFRVAPCSRPAGRARFRHPASGGLRRHTGHAEHRSSGR